MDTSNRRRVMIVGSVQRRLLLAYAVHTGLVVGLFVAALYVPPLLSLRGAGALSPERTAILEEIISMHSRLWPALILALVAVAAHAVMITHRVAGPLVQIHRAAREIAAGNLEHRIVQRSNDYLGAEIASINTMLDTFAHHLADAHHERHAQRAAQDSEKESPETVSL